MTLKRKNIEKICRDAFEIEEVPDNYVDALFYLMETGELPENYLKMISLHDSGKSYTDIAKYYNLSTSRIRQIAIKTYSRIRRCKERMIELFEVGPEEYKRLWDERRKKFDEIESPAIENMAALFDNSVDLLDLSDETREMLKSYNIKSMDDVCRLIVFNNKIHGFYSISSSMKDELIEACISYMRCSVNTVPDPDLMLKPIGYLSLSENEYNAFIVRTYNKFKTVGDIYDILLDDKYLKIRLVGSMKGNSVKNKCQMFLGTMIL